MLCGNRGNVKCDDVPFHLRILLPVTSVVLLIMLSTITYIWSWLTFQFAVNLALT